MKPVRINWKWMALMLTVVLVLAACKKAEPAPAVVEPEPPATEVAEPAEEPEDVPAISQPIARWNAVVDQVWVLVGYGDAASPDVVEEGTVITAVFGEMDRQVTGSAGCNNYFSAYTADDDGNLTIDGPIGVTMMFCETGMEQEAAYLAALETVSGYVVTDEGRLELTYDSGEPYEQKLVYAPGETALTGTIWRLVSYGDPDDLEEVEEGTSITAVFSPETDTTGTLAGNATCNGYTTGYQLDGDQISVGPIAGTMMKCPVGADQEVAYLAALDTAETFQIVGPYLQIAYEDGVLNYSSVNLPLENVLWQAVMVLGEPVPEEVEITVLFVPGEEEGEETLGGNAGCNDYSTGYEVSGDRLSVPGPIAMTMAICPDETLADLEQSYLAALEKAGSYEILGDRMVLHTEDGEILFAADREPLEGTYWVLISLGDIDDPQPPVEGSEFTAVFSRLPTLPSGTVVGTTGCNEYNATYTANVNEIKVNLPWKTKNEDCPWGAGNYEVEQQFFLGLNSATSYRIIGGLLQIPYGEAPTQQVLNFLASEPPVEEVLDLSPLDNTFWYLASVGDTPVLPGIDVTAAFEINDDGVTGRMSGSGGCNAYNTEICQNFAIGPIATTRKACEQPVMDQESNYLAWLGTAYNYSRAGDQLLISTAKGILTYHSQPILDQQLELQGVTWHAVSYETAKAVPGYNPTAFFSPDGKSLNGTTGCNDLTGEYNAEQGNKLTIGGLTSTKAACGSDALTDQEQGYLKLLESAVSYSVNNTQLQILTSAGGTLNFSSVPPGGPVPPTAVIEGPTLGETSQRMAFDGSKSTAGSTRIAKYEWDMGDGSYLSGSKVRYVCDTPGTYTVRLKVTDRGGQSGTAAHVVQVTPVVVTQPPTAVIYGPTLGETGQQLTFDGSGSKPGTAAIASYEWNMGDGTILTGASVQHTYNDPGTPNVTLKVTDKAGESGTATHAVQITPVVEVEPPTAVIYGPTLGETGHQLTFDGSGSKPGAAAITSYEWNMGDGTVLSGVSVRHTYNKPGTPNVTLKVTDKAGESDTATQAVQITPVLEVTPPKAAIQGPRMAFVGESVAFSAVGSQQGTGAIAGYLWQSGDGNNTDLVAENTFTTIFNQPGTCYPSVTVVDANSLQDTASTSIVINATLEGSNWYLANAIPGTSITLDFANGTLSGFAGCNSYSAGYTSTRAAGPTNNITVGPITSSQALCSEEIMNQEQAYLAALQSATAYTISGTTLTLTTAGEPLTFGAAVATPYAAQ